MFKLIRTFLSNRTLQVRIGTCLSLKKRSESGTPRGSVLSPILFSIMIHDLPGLISSSQPFMLMVSAFGKVGPTLNSWNTSVRNLFPWSTVGSISLVSNSLHPKPLQFLSLKREN